MIPDKSATLTAVGIFLMFLSVFFAWNDEIFYTFLFYGLSNLFFVLGWWTDPNHSFGGYVFTSCLAQYTVRCTCNGRESNLFHYEAM